MKCPNCKEPDLLMTERQSIEIDYCPTCRGIWLDRGELDRLIEKAQAEVAANTAEPVAAATPQFKQNGVNQDAYYQQQYNQGKYHNKHNDDYYKHQKHYKRKSLLSEIFDF
jgi:Zn-finger nucleic acid-binding protein